MELNFSSQLAMCECRNSLRCFYLIRFLIFLDVTCTWNSFFIHCNKNCNCFLVVLNVKPSSCFVYFISTQIENLTLEWHTHSHTHMHMNTLHGRLFGVGLWGIRTIQFIKTDILFTVTYISNVMCQKINNPYMFPYIYVCVHVWVCEGCIELGVIWSKAYKFFLKHMTYTFFPFQINNSNSKVILSFEIIISVERSNLKLWRLINLTGDRV